MSTHLSVRTPPPAPAASRRPRPHVLDMARGLLALGCLAAMTLGVPWLLLHVGRPLPQLDLHSPAAAAHGLAALLLRPDDGSLFLAALTLAGWAAWATFTAATVLEVLATLRVPAVPAIPQLAFQQRTVAGLVASVAVLVTGPVAVAAPPVPASAAVLAGDPPAAMVTSPQAPTHSSTNAPSPEEVGEEVLTVQRGDTLWSIARDHLGDGRAYPRIAAASGALTQPGGRHLQDPDLILPGWQLLLPARGGQPISATPGPSGAAPATRAPDQMAPPSGSPAPSGASAPSASTPPATPAPSSTPSSTPSAAPPVASSPPASTPAVRPSPRTASSSPAVVRPADPSGTPLVTPAATASATPSNTASVTPSATTFPSTPQGPAAGTGAPSLELLDGLRDPSIIAGIGLSALTAAGLLSLLKRKRSRQRRHRRPGERLPMPPAPAQVSERRLREAEDPLSLTQLDTLLRDLARHYAASGQPLPALQWVRLLPDHTEFHLAVPATASAPFRAHGLDSVWTVEHDDVLASSQQRDTEDIATSVDEADHALAPYPALTAVGVDLDGAQILLDLTAVGRLDIASAAVLSREDAAAGLPTAEAVAAALVVDLATTPWSEETDVVAVGLCADLVAALDVGRVRYAGDVSRLLVELGAWAANTAAAMREAQGHGLRLDRGQGELSEVLSPRVVIVGPEVAQADLRQLAGLRRENPLLPLAVVTVGHAQHTEHTQPGPAGLAVGQSARILEGDRDRAWSLTLDGSGPLARLEPCSLRLRPHHLDASVLQHALTTLHAAAEVTRGRTSPPPLPTARLSTEDIRKQLGEPARDPDADADTDAGARRAGKHVREEVLAEGGPPPLVDAAPFPPADEVIVDGALGVHADTADADEDDKQAAPQGAGVVDASAAAPGVAAGPTLLLLGPVDIVGARGDFTSDSPRSRQLETIAYLAMRPHRERFLLDEALWPGERVPDGRRQQLVSRARRWLGVDDAGQPFIPPVNPDGYRLSPAVTSDWQQFQAMVGPDPQMASTQDLLRALSLVRGQPFGGSSPRRFAWADPDRQEMISAIADVAHEVAQRGVEDGDASLARRAAAVGLQVEPASEALWRAALQAEWLSGNRAALESLADRLEALADDLGGDLEPETTALLQRLLPAAHAHPRPSGGVHER